MVVIITIIYEKNYTRELLKKASVRYTNFHFPQGIIIFRDNVTFVHWGENPFAVRIVNKEMARQFKEFFLEFYYGCFCFGAEVSGNFSSGIN